MAVAPEDEFDAVAAELQRAVLLQPSQCEGHIATSRVKPLSPSADLEVGPDPWQGVILQQLQCIKFFKSMPDMGIFGVILE